MLHPLYIYSNALFSFLQASTLSTHPAVHSHISTSTGISTGTNTSPVTHFLIDHIHTPLPDSLTLRTQRQLEKFHGVFEHISQLHPTAPSQKSQSNRTALRQTFQSNRTAPSQMFQYAVRGTVGKGGFGYTLLAHMTTTNSTTSGSNAKSNSATVVRKKKNTEGDGEKCERMVVMKVHYFLT